MVLHILGIDRDADPELNSSQTTQSENPDDLFWVSASDILIHMANARPSLGEAVQATIASGGDVEITAHNEPGRVSLTLVDRSGARKLLFDNRQRPVAYQTLSTMELPRIFRAMQSEHEEHCERLKPNCRNSNRG